MTDIDNAIRHYMAASAQLVQTALADAAAEDREGTEGLARAMAAGAVLELVTSLTTTGLAQLAVHIVSPTGERLGRLMSCELQREAHQ